VVTVFVPSVLKKPKTSHYSPVYQGTGSDAPDGLITQMGESAAFLQDIYLVVFLEERHGPTLRTSGLQMTSEIQTTHDFRTVHIYIDEDPYANEPRPDIQESEDTTIEMEPELPPQIIPVELPDFDMDAIGTISLEFTLYDKVVEPLPEIVEIEPSVKSYVTLDTISDKTAPDIAEVSVISEPQVVEVNDATVMFFTESEIIKLNNVKNEQKTITVEQPKVQKVEVVIINEVDPYSVEIEEETSNGDMETHNIGYTEVAIETVSKAYIGSINSNFAIIWFTVLAMIVGLYLGYIFKKRR
jgi:hypothetical protein